MLASTKGFFKRWMKCTIFMDEYIKQGGIQASNYGDTGF
jgi:hypothetical protein